MPASDKDLTRAAFCLDNGPPAMRRAHDRKSSIFINTNLVFEEVDLNRLGANMHAPDFEV